MRSHGVSGGGAFGGVRDFQSSKNTKREEGVADITEWSRSQLNARVKTVRGEVWYRSPPSSFHPAGRYTIDTKAQREEQGTRNDGVNLLVDDNVEAGVASARGGVGERVVGEGPGVIERLNEVCR